MEIWKDVQGFEGFYEVSNEGRVRSFDRVINASNGRSYTRKGRILKPSDGNGYSKVQLKGANGKEARMFIHRLVALAFMPNPEDKLTVNHKDGIKTNNHLSNLEWNTYKENNVHAMETGLRKKIPKGEESGVSVLTEEGVKEIREKYSGCGGTYTAKELGTMLGTSEHNVRSVAAGVTWKHVNDYSGPANRDKISKSGYENVYCHGNRFRSRFALNKQKYDLGIFDTAVEAYEAGVNKREELLKAEVEGEAK